MIAFNNENRCNRNTVQSPGVKRESKQCLLLFVYAHNIIEFTTPNFF